MVESNVKKQKLTYDAYTIGWLCVLRCELNASRGLLDEEHEPLESLGKDDNSYVLGRMEGHNVVIAFTGSGVCGTNAASHAATNMVRTFRNIRFGLMVGVAGGAPKKPHPSDPDKDIRLGDVVVSVANGEHGGVIQYDMGKQLDDEFRIQSHLNKPPSILSKAIEVLQSDYDFGEAKIAEYIKHVAVRSQDLRALKGYMFPGRHQDQLFRSSYRHAGGEDCSECEQSQVEHRLTRESDQPVIHHGLVASGNAVVKSARHRDELRDKWNVLCFEMEAAGLMDDFPCIVIRGVCDYSDDHKHKVWQPYAAVAAAAYAKDLLRVIQQQTVENMHAAASLIKQFEGVLLDINSTATETKASINLMASEAHVERISRWLSPPDPSSNANKARDVRQTGTGGWFLDSAVFKEWKGGSRQHVWLHGISGCGKTVLSTTILDHLLHINNHIVLSFYFDFGDNKKQKLGDILRSLIFQLYVASKETRIVLDTWLAAHDAGRREPSTKELSSIFREMVKRDSVYIILDGLDECVTRTELLDWIKSVASGDLLGHMQLIATGRPEQEFESYIPEFIGHHNCLGISDNDVNEDIKSYVKARLDQGGFRRWASQPEVLEKIKKTIYEKSKEMFRWAVCQLDNLEECLRLADLEAALESLPRNLTETYDRMLSKIPTRYKADSIRLLQILVYSERPLSIHEAVEVIAIPRNMSDPFDTRLRLADPREITRYCPGFVTQVTNGQFPEEFDELHLSHLSVKEYFICQDTGPFHPATANGEITRLCLYYLGTCCLESRPNLPFEKYSVRCWMRHASYADTDPAVQDSILRFFSEQPHVFETWTKLYTYGSRSVPRGIISQGLPTPIAGPLYFATEGHLRCIIELLLKTGIDVNAKGGYLGNALQAASYARNEKIVHLLLNAGADVNAKGGNYENALQAAIHSRSESMVKLLVERGADISARTSTYGTALQSSVSLQLDNIVRLLLANGADVNAQGARHGNALQDASYRGAENIVQQLLANGANVNAQGGVYGNALQAASFSGHSRVVGQLLEKQADVDAEGGEFGTALLAASFSGQESIVRLLLEKGARTYALSGGKHGSALQAAQLGGSETTDVETLGTQFGTALQAASYAGHLDIVQQLVEHKAEIESQCGRFGSALHVAAFMGHESILRYLLEHGAHVNEVTGICGTAIQAAVCCRKNELKNFPYSPPKKTRTNPGAAADKDHCKLIKLLLNHGGEVNAQGGYYGNALLAAAYEGNGRVAQYLLENGADIRSQIGPRVLQLACENEHDDIVQWLRDEELDDFSYMLLAASYGGFTSIVKWLLATGQNADLAAAHYDKAIHGALKGGHADSIRLLTAWGNSKEIVTLRRRNKQDRS